MEPTIMPYVQFISLCNNNKGQFKTTHEKTLSDGTRCAIVVGASFVCVLVNKTPYIFKENASAVKFFIEMKDPPPGTVKHEYKVDCKQLDEPADYNYQLLTYKFFVNTKLRSIRVLSENFLPDGRVSVIYVKHWHSSVDGFVLVIGRLVFTHWKLEEIKKLELAIMDGYMIFWRPELAGTMDYIPKYKISVYDEARHKRFTSKEAFVKSYQMPDNQKADVYKWVNKTVRYYMFWLDKVYFFLSLEDCGLIIQKLQAYKRPFLLRADELPYPAGGNINAPALQDSVKVMAARLSRYMSADMSYFNPHSSYTISPKGELNSKSATI